MKIAGITSPTTVIVTVAEGNMMLVNSEFIGFTSVDFVNNSVTGLQRGRNGTITNQLIERDTDVQSVLDRDRLRVQYYNQWWYGNGVDSPVSFDGTLYESTSESALFLKKTTP
jgi:hypothetical protein